MKKKLYLALILTVLMFSGTYAWRSEPFILLGDQADLSESAIFGSPDYNAVAEFSVTPRTPTSIWHYGKTSGPTSNVFEAFPDTNTYAPCSGTPGSGTAFQEWRNNSAALPQLGLNVSGSIFVCGTLRVPTDAIYLHPGPDGSRAVLRWRAPSDGTYQVGGVFQGLDSTGSRDVYIFVNGTAIWATTPIVNGLEQKPFDLTVPMLAGEFIDFHVGANGGSNYDATGLSVSIRQPVTACATVPADIRANILAENSPIDVQSVNTRASLVGDAKYTNAGKVGRSFEFDGNGDYVRIEDNAAQRPANAVTVEGWFKFDSTAGLISLVSKPLRNSAWNSFTLFMNGGTLRGFVANPGQYTQFNSGFSPQLGVWHHLAFTYNYSGGIATGKLYANGVEVTTGQEGSVNLPLYYDADPYPLLIGGEFENNGPAFFLDGQADEVSVYGRALSSYEMIDIVQQGSFGKCPPANSASVPDGLVSWYSGEGNAFDSKSNNHGVMQNGASFANGRVGQSMSFDGIDDQFVAPDSNSLDIIGDLTIEGWIEPSSNPAFSHIVSKRNLNNADAEFDLLRQSDGRIRFSSKSSGTDNFVISTGAAATGVFTHVAVTIEGSTLKFYINGALDSTHSYGFSRIATSGSLTIGTAQATACGGSGFCEYFAGKIDELSLYNRSLTANDISSVAVAGQSGKRKPSAIASPENQIAWFTGDGHSRDMTGNTSTGTLVGDTTYRVGRVGQAFKFDGNGDVVTTPDSPTWDLGTGDFAIEAWINTPSGTGVQRIISAGAMSDGANNLWSLGYGDICAWGCNQRINLAVYNGGGYSDFSSDIIQIRPNTWHHVAVTRSTTAFTFYFDGVAVGTRPVGAGFALNGGSTGAIIGARYNGNPGDRFEFANGMLDEISLYSRAITDGEVASIYVAGKSGKSKRKPTATGTNVHTELSDATVTFASVLADGTTSQNNIDLGMMPPLPSTATYTGLGYNISSTATYQSGLADDMKVCFNIPSLADTPTAALRVLQLVGNTWINRTASGNTHANFCTDNVSSLSQFVIVQDSGTQLYTASGRVTNSNGFGISGVWVQLSDGVTVFGNVPTDANGDYAWTNLVGGESYTLTPILANNTFTPATRSLPNVSANVVNADFVAAPTSQCLAANYEFNNDLNSTGVTAPALSYIGTGQTFAVETVNGVSRPVLTYTGGNAVELRPTSGVIPSNQYEITIVTKFNQTYSYNRILDFKDGSDAGIYVTSGMLTFYGAGASGPPSVGPGVWVELKFTRTAAGIFTAYVNGVQQFSFNDTGGAGIIGPTGALRFFKDDGNEHYGGAIAKIQLSAGGCGSTHSIAGNINDGTNNMSGVSVALSGGANASTTTDANGNYSFANLPSGLNYTVTPTVANYTFTPPTRTYNALAANVTDANFTGASSCTFTADPDFSQYSAAAGNGSFNIVTQPGCQWTAAPDTNSSPWVTLTSSGTGTGNGMVSYSVAANTNILRIGQINVNGNAAHSIGQQTGTGTCPTVTPITYGTIINDALANSDCDLSGRFADQYSFSGTMGDRIMIRLSSSDFAESVILHNSANTAIYTVATGGAAGDARVPNSYGFFTLPATGTYIISASRWGNGGSPTGNYTLTLHSDRTVPGVTPPSGLIGWYAGEGDTRNQQSNSPGTFNGTPTYLTDYAGQSFSMNGTDRYVEVPSATEPFNVSSLSVEAWVNTTTTASVRTIASKFDGAGGASWSLDMEPGGAMIFTVYDGTTANFRAVRTSGAAAFLTANEWKHVAATFDDTTQAITIYVNGADAGTLVAGSASSIGGVGQNSVPLRIGAKSNGSIQGYWQGRLDEVSIYNRAITHDEVKSIIDAGRIGKIKQASLNNQTTAALGTSTINFAVATTGTATETPIEAAALPAPLPTGQGLHLAFNISTNAPFTGNATVCFAVPTVTPAEFAGLKVYHLEGGVWVDRTAPGNVCPTLCALTPSFSPFAIAKPLAPTSSSANVSGRILTADGRGINNTILTLSLADGLVLRTRSSSLGYYRFDSVDSGQTGVLSVHSKRFTFATPNRVIAISNDLSEVDFIAEP